MPLIIDNVGFVYIDGVRVFRYIPTRQALQFWDKDRRRSSERGSRHVEVELDRLMRVLNGARLLEIKQHSRGEKR